VVSASVALKAIRTGWDGMLRFAASVRTGQISANVGLRLWVSAASRDPTRRAAEELGRLLRTQFLCDYFTNPDFRRELHTLQHHTAVAVNRLIQVDACAQRGDDHSTLCSTMSSMSCSSRSLVRCTI
jgi:TnpA family transposase